jgi:hypothetical protein
MDGLKVFDAYALRARIFPAIIASAPALAALGLLISWKSFGLSNVVSTIAMVVLLFAIADFARARGRAVEQKLYAEMGGPPSITMFRRSDSTISEDAKERYRSFLAGKLQVAAPTGASEQADPASADSFYDQCGIWLRQQTRDTKRFPLVFAENVTYGFRRNLLGVRGIALALNLAVVAVCLFLLWRQNWAWEGATSARIIVVLLVAALHFAYIVFAVRRAAVCDAARAYARELILSCEALVGSAASERPKRPARRFKSTKVKDKP